MDKDGWSRFDGIVWTTRGIPNTFAPTRSLSRANHTTNKDNFDCRESMIQSVANEQPSNVETYAAVAANISILLALVKIDNTIVNRPVKISTKTRRTTGLRA